MKLPCGFTFTVVGCREFTRQKQLGDPARLALAGAISRRSRSTRNAIAAAYSSRQQRGALPLQPPRLCVSRGGRRARARQRTAPTAARSCSTAGTALPHSLAYSPDLMRWRASGSKAQVRCARAGGHKCSLHVRLGLLRAIPRLPGGCKQASKPCRRAWISGCGEAARRHSASTAVRIHCGAHCRHPLPPPAAATRCRHQPASLTTQRVNPSL